MKRVVIGVGNPDRGDDGAGREAARRLRPLLPDVEVLEASGEATALLALLEGADVAILIDACVSGGSAGAVRCFDAARAPLPASYRSGLSSHGFGLAAALELAAALGQTPPRCEVYAIEGADFAPGAPLSAAVEAAVARVMDEVCNALRDGTDALPASRKRG